MGINHFESEILLKTLTVLGSLLFGLALNQPVLALELGEAAPETEPETSVLAGPSDGLALFPEGKWRSGRNLYGTNLTEANLWGASLTGAYLIGTIFCETKMPDGTLNNSGC